MFCNGPKMDGGDTARLGPTTIIEMTIPRCQSSLVMTLDDTEGLAGPLYFSPLPCINFQRSYLASYALLSWLLPSNILLITKVPSIQSFKGCTQPCKSLQRKPHFRQKYFYAFLILIFIFYFHSFCPPHASRFLMTNFQTNYHLAITFPRCHVEIFGGRILRPIHCFLGSCLVTSY